MSVKNIKIRLSADNRSNGGLVRVRVVGGSAVQDGAYSKYIPEIVAHALTMIGPVTDECFTYTLPFKLS
ncbi:hypothetical protein [Sodaliphilus sp.]|uniref:hypothetical protein n=1 Tax=Sodaliphilus sp. TaxID=2815818 RepID=UPI00388EDA01